MYRRELFQVLPFSILIVAVYSVVDVVNLPITGEIIWWPLQALVIFGFGLYYINVFNQESEESMLIINLFICWMIINCIRGIFIAESYWDYKLLVSNTMVFLIPLVVYASTNMAMVQKILRFFVMWAIPVFLILVPFMSGRGYGMYLAPIGVLLLFLPVLEWKWRILILALALFSILFALGDRKNIIKFGIPILLLGIYYGQQIIPGSLLNKARLILLFAPFILFTLGTSGTFNIFKMSDYINSNYQVTLQDKDGGIDKGGFTDDTRTFIYMEVLETAKKYNSWIFGRSMAKGYESPFFETTLITDYRARSETAIPNIFIYSGLIGVILYFLIFYKASYLAINLSNNIFCKMAGLMITIIWCYSWVGYSTFFRLPFFLIWIIAGMCFSRSFRMMSNEEIKYWARGIFDKRYADAWVYINTKKVDKLKKIHQ